MNPGPAVPECRDEVCVTCSDQAVPARVERLLGGGMAIADTGAASEEISVAFVEAQEGDLVLVHAKEAISRIEEETDGGAR